MDNNILYKESVFSKGITIILGIFSVLISVLFIVQLSSGPVGSKPAPNLILGIMTGFFILTTINFSFLRITMTDKYIRIAYGIIGSKRLWENLQVCELDSENKFFGGWGIRFGRYKNDWIWVYNIIGGSRVAFLRKPGKSKSLMVSTKNPEEMVRIANEQIS